MLQFAYPYLLFLLLPVALWVYASLRRKPGAIVFSAASRLGKVAGKTSSIRARMPLILRALTLTLLVLAMARPQTVNVAKEIKTPGVDIMLCLDTSGSMQALDFTLDGKPVDRLTAVKKVVRDFVKKRDNDRVGLIVFGTHAFTQAPLTLDKGLLITLIDRMKIGMAGTETAIGDALALAGKRIKDIPAMSKIVIMLSDGANTSGELSTAEAASALAALGIKVYVIGVGTNEEVPVEMQGFFGSRIVKKRFEIDEPALREMARIGQGKYFNASNTQELEAIYAEIDKAEKTEAKVKVFFHFKEHYRWFLGIALLIALFEMAGFWGRAIP